MSTSDSSKCAVCSAPTQSWRYQALACSACASFFYRCALMDNEKRLVCENVETTDPRVCFEDYRCRSCRLKLCVASGMSNEVIRFNAEARKVTKERRSDTKTRALEGIQAIVLNPPSATVVVDRVLADLQRIEIAFNKIRESTFNPTPGSVGSLDEALNGTSKLAVHYEKMEGWPITLPEEYSACDGSIVENMFRILEIGMEQEYCKANRKFWYFSNVIYAIEYFKAFEVFRKLSSNTRRILAGKMALLCSNFVNHYYSMRRNRRCIVSPDGTEPFGGVEKDFAREMQTSAALIDQIKELDLDECEYVILKLLIILSPSLEDTSSYERAILTRHSENYTKILFSYVLARRGSEKGPASYQGMLALIGTISHMVKREKDLQLLYGAVGMYHELCPLLEEIVLI